MSSDVRSVSDPERHHSRMYLGRTHKILATMKMDIKTALIVVDLELLKLVD